MLASVLDSALLASVLDSALLSSVLASTDVSTDEFEEMLVFELSLLGFTKNEIALSPIMSRKKNIAQNFVIFANIASAVLAFPRFIKESAPPVIVPRPAS